MTQLSQTGYTSRDIAVITNPARVSLLGAPNFVQFASKASVKTLLQFTLKVVTSGSIDAPGYAATTLLNITEPSGVVHSFIGTRDLTLVGGNTFYISAVQADTAENLRSALMDDKYIAANFNVVIPYKWVADAVQNGDTLTVTSKAAGADYNIVVTKPNDPSNTAYVLALVHATSTNNDSISGEASTAEIELDVYVDAPVFAGQDDRPVSVSELGQYVISLQKTYAGSPVWFEINALFSKDNRYNLPAALGWFDTGTARTFRFVAKVRGTNSFSFYQSNALYGLNGYAYPSEKLNMLAYVYESTTVKLLTNKPRTVYVRGQREYLNFIFSDPLHGASSPADFTLNVCYRAYDTTGAFLGSAFSHTVARVALSIVNTCVLRIDDLLDAFSQAAVVKVSLARGSVIVSDDLEYEIRPASLHGVKQFSFLNRLGGWDSFNFDATPTEDTKVVFDTFSKTITPSYARGASVETVYGAELDDVFTITGAPVTDAVADWLKELQAATVVLDSDGNYIIKTEFTISASDSARNMQTPVMKYKLSETYTNE